MLQKTIEEKLRTREWTPEIKRFDSLDGPSSTFNTGLVAHVIRPKEGGILTYFWGYKYPYKGSPGPETMNRLGVVKRIIRIIIFSFNEKTRKEKIWLGLVMIIPFTRKIIFSLLTDLISSFTDWQMRMDDLSAVMYPLTAYFKPERYCTCVRELNRVFNVLSDREKDRTFKKLWLFIRNFAGSLIEFDSAYRFRFQDIFAEIKKEELLGGKNRMINEIKRVLEIAEAREMYAHGMIERWQMFKKNICLVLRFSRKARKMMEDFIKEADFKKIIPDEGDRYLTALREDYDFAGKTLEERIEERKKIDGDNWKYFEEEADILIKEYHTICPKVKLREARNNVCENISTTGD